MTTRALEALSKVKTRQEVIDLIRRVGADADDNEYSDLLFAFAVKLDDFEESESATPPTAPAPPAPQPTTKTETPHVELVIEPVDLFRGPDQVWRCLLRVDQHYWAVQIPVGAFVDFRQAGIPVRKGHV